MRGVVVVLLLSSACGRVGFDPLDGGRILDAPISGACLSWSPFTTPARIEVLGGPGVDWAPSISRDGLRLTFSSSRAGTQDLYVSTRATTSTPWSAPVILAGFDTGADLEDDPTLTADELEIYFGKNQLFRATRSSPTAAFGPKIEIVNSPSFDLVQGSELSPDDLHLYFSAGSPAQKLYVMDRASRADAFVDYALVPDPDPTGDLGYPTLSSDDLEMFVSSAHAGERDIWRSARTDPGQPFPAVTRVAELSAPGDDYDPELSFDGATMWMASSRQGTMDIFVATRTCLAR